MKSNVGSTNLAINVVVGSAYVAGNMASWITGKYVSLNIFYHIVI
jgi:hypothetical protein